MSEREKKQRRLRRSFGPEFKAGAVKLSNPLTPSPGQGEGVSSLKVRCSPGSRCPAYQPG